MRTFQRSAAALLAAAVLVVLAGDVSVFAQRDYEGPLFWMADPDIHPGSVWTTSPVRAWPDGGTEWGAATSFPPRVWEYHVADAPPNDPCEPLPVTTDPFLGPWGLQVNTYLGEWWEGTTYASHPNPPDGYSDAEYGSFDFRPFHESGRTLLSPQGVPSGLIGNPGACAGRALAFNMGRGDSQWRPRVQKNGLDCLSIPHFFRLRMNVEMRCEADLRVRDDFTERFWLMFDARVPFPVVLPDGVTEAPLLFPVDYAAGPLAPFNNPPSYVGRLWMRRVDLSLDKWVYETGDESLSSVFNVGGGGGFGAVAGHRPTYTTIHDWRLEGSAADRRSLARNPFVTIDATGAITDHQTVSILDALRNEEDCLAFNQYSYEDASDDTLSPCGRDTSAMPGTFTFQDGAHRMEDVGFTTPAQVAGVLTAPMIPGARGNRRPFPISSDLFWLEWDTYASACGVGYSFIGDLARPALRFRDAWLDAFEDQWELYLELQLDWTIPFFEREAILAEALAEAVFMRGTAEGWDVIYQYRLQTQPEIEAAFAAAGYTPGSTMADVGTTFEGAPAAGCGTDGIMLQPMRAMTRSYASSPPGGLPGADQHLMRDHDVHMTGSSELVRMFGDTQDVPHYGQESLSLRAGGVSHLAHGMMRPGRQYPTGPTHWDGPFDIDDSPGYYVPLV